MKKLLPIIFSMITTVIYAQNDFQIDFTNSYQSHKQANYNFLFNPHREDQLHRQMLAYLNSPEYREYCLQKEQEKKEQLAKEDKTYKQEFGISKNELITLLKYKKYALEQWLIKSKNLTKEQAIAIWHKKCLQSYRYNKNKDLAHHRILHEFKQRKKKEEQEKKAQKTYIEQSKIIYNANIVQNQAFQSPYQAARQQALEETEKNKYQKYQKTYDIDTQTAGLMQAHGIQAPLFNIRKATALQHQLYSEVADCYKQIAKFFHGQTLSESILAQKSLEFATCVHEATELEVMELAIAMSDIVYICSTCACSIYSGINQGIADFSHTIINPIPILIGLGVSIGKVMKYVADAGIYCDSEGIGWSYYVKQLEEEHAYDAEYAQKLIDQLYEWMDKTPWDKKVECIARMGTEAILYEQLFATTRSVCTNLIAEIPEVRFLKSFTDLYKEYDIATELGNVGLNSMQDVEMSLLKSEIDNFAKKSSKSNVHPIIKNKKFIYKEAPYHHQNSKGSSFSGKSPSPKDGQKALDNSILFKTKGNQKYQRRIGIEDDYFVIFDEQRPGEFHGHIRTWKELTIEMKNIINKEILIKK